MRNATVMPTNEEVKLLPALPFREAQDMYREALNAAADFDRDPASWLDVFDGETVATLRRDLLEQVEEARKIHALAAARAGIYS